MKALVTGANGTVGKALCALMARKGHEAIAWDRSKGPVDDYCKMEDYIRAVSPDIIYHLAIASKPTGKDNEGHLVNYHWPSEVAWIARLRGIPFIFTSTAMVFTNDARGPFFPNTMPDAKDGYGGEKRRAEERVIYQNPETRVVRLGWQIGTEPGSNNMIDFFDKNQREQGHVRASTKWFPACSFLEDTADALIRVRDLAPGLYQLDGNRAGNTFHEVATALNKKHGNQWKIEATEDFVYDQRLMDERLPVKGIGETLKGLRT